MNYQFRKNVSAISSNLISLIVHFVIVIVLGMIPILHHVPSTDILIVSDLPDEYDDPDNLDLTSIQFETDPLPQPTPADEDQAEIEVVDDLHQTDLGAGSLVQDAVPPVMGASVILETGHFGSLDLASLLVPIEPPKVGGNGGAGDGGAADGSSAIAQRPGIRGAHSPSEAVSGLGGDIARRLKTGNVLVLWMFDASLSMSSDRILAAKQMSIVLHEIKGLSQNSIHYAQHSLLCFGETLTPLQKPTRKWSSVVRKVSRVRNDISGRENVFSAIRYAIPGYRKKWSDQILFIVWTDESGDDIDRLEDTIALCRQEKVSVSVVGPTAVLGRQRGAQFFHIPKLYRYRGYLPVEKGPDAAVRQLVALPHWFGKPLPVFGGLVPNVLPSGFGPYHLVRLSQATGGSFTSYDRIADRGNLKVENLVAYLPNYGPADAVRRDALKHDLRRAVVEAAEITARVENLPTPLFNPKNLPEFFYWKSPNEYRPLFATFVKRDLRNVKRAIPVIEEAYKILTRRHVQDAFEKEKSPRWKANYLLARGRLAAISVRHREYEVLAHAIFSGRAFRPDTNHASIVTTGTIHTGEWGAQRSRDAKLYLNRCIQEHPGTPWAELASWELRYGLGLRLSQTKSILVSGGSTGPPPIIQGPSI